jgi:hypothetical protein
LFEVFQCVFIYKLKEIVAYVTNLKITTKRMTRFLCHFNDLSCFSFEFKFNEEKVKIIEFTFKTIVPQFKRNETKDFSFQKMNQSEREKRKRR